MRALLKDGGRMLCSDFHPLNKIMNVLGFWGREERPAEITVPDYFDSGIKEVEMAHAQFYDEEKRSSFPKCLIRGHTLSDIINAALSAGFRITGFDEHPAWTNPKLPGEFTLIAEKHGKL